jgi:hypothetical protein
MSVTQRDLTLAEVAELRRFTPRYLRELSTTIQNSGIALGEVDPL